MPSVADEDLLRSLFDEHAPALLSYALHLVDGDRGRAEDVVQETLLRAWRHPEALARDRGRSAPLAVRRRQAARGRRASSPAGAPAARSSDGDAVLAQIPAQDDDVDRALDAWLVADALAALTLAHREVLAQTYFARPDGRRGRRRARRPAGTVKSRTHYALQALRLALTERGVTS